MLEHAASARAVWKRVTGCGRKRSQPVARPRRTNGTDRERKPLADPVVFRGRALQCGNALGNAASKTATAESNNPARDRGGIEATARSRMRILNYTPHPVVIAGVEYPSVGTARVAVEEKIITRDDMPVPVVEETFGEIVGLPDVRSVDEIVLVSRVVADAMKRQIAAWKGDDSSYYWEEEDARAADYRAAWARMWEGGFAVPASFIRDENGRITGARGVAFI